MPNLSTLADWAQIIGVLVAIVVPWWLYLRSRQRRALVCELNPIEFPIEVRAGTAIKGDIEIRYRGEVVRNLFLVRAKLKNTGNQVIREAHVLRGLMFDFGPGVEVLRLPIGVERKPKNIELYSYLPKFGRTEGKPSMIGLNFDLLNPGDEITIEFLCSGESEVPQVVGRIEGVSEIEVLNPEAMRAREALGESLRDYRLTLVVCLGMSIGLALVLLPWSDAGLSIFGAFVVSFLVLAGILTVVFLGADIGPKLIQVWRMKRNRNRKDG